jgi:hypothetical protein
MIAELRPSSGSRLWVLTGHPCQRRYVDVAFADAGSVDLSTV